MPRSIVLPIFALALIPPASFPSPLASVQSNASAPQSVTVHFTAPGDDGWVGRATRYELRYSNIPMNFISYRFAKVIPGLPRPSEPGTIESLTVAVELMPEVRYYFAMRSVDDVGNWSGISNIGYLEPESRQALTVSLDAVSCWFSRPQPNPARTATRFSFALPEAAAIEVNVFDVTGRRVRALSNGWHAAGQDELSWDLRTDSGARAAPGLYLVRARLASRVWTRTVSVVQ